MFQFVELVIENPLHTVAILSCFWLVFLIINIRTYMQHSGKESKVCPVCGRNYKSIGWLGRHIQIKHEEFHRARMAKICHMFGIENPL